MMYRQLYRLMRMIRPREFRSLKYLRELERNQWLSQDEIQHISWQKLKKLLEHAYKNVPFYRARFEQIGATPTDIRTQEDFGQFPLLSKDDIRVYEGELIAQSYDKNRMRRDMTSGSTGIPLVVYHDDHRVPIDNAAFTHSRRWFGVQPGDKAAWLWGRKDDLPADTWLARLITTLKRERWFNTFRVSDKDMQTFAEMLLKWQPDYLVGYATATYFFARYISSHHITGFHLKAIETTAGTLWPHERRTIEKTFDCRVFDRYGSHEVGHIAAECEHGRMHIFPDICYVEVLTSDQLASEGKDAGEIVTTPLYSYGMPLIRFRIGDVGIFDERACPCGRGLPVLREIIGRTNSIITLPSGKYLYGGIFLTILEDIPKVRQFQVHQPTKNKLEITLEKGPGFSEETMNLVRERVRRLLRNEPIQVSIFVTDEILPTVSGKYLVTTSDVPITFAEV